VDYKMKYVHKVKARGKTFLYYRRSGLNIRLKNTEGAAFLVEYARVDGSFTVEKKPSNVGTLDHLCEAYIASPEYRQLAPQSRKNIGPRLDKLRKVHGKMPITEIRVPFVRAIQSDLQDTPGKANAYTQIIGRLLNFAAAEEMIPFNPIAKKIKPLKMGAGHLPWPEKVLTEFEKSAGRTPKLAMLLALYTGQREADIVKMRWSDVQDGMIRVRQNKTGAELFIPIHPKLQTALDEAKRASKGLSILQQRNGRPYTLNGFKTVWHEDKSRVKGFVFHGLRKNATVALFECGCTVQEVQAITGHATMSMVQHYGKGANQRRLANAAMQKWKTGSANIGKADDK